MSLGPAEILVILVVALIVFGPKRLPEVGRQVGSAVRELRKMQDTVKSELHSVVYPDLSPSDTPPRIDTADAVEEPDHTMLPAPDMQPPDTPDDPFAGPSGSFS